MSADPTISIQAALYAALTGTAFQTACGVAVGVYDHVPQAAKPPYLIISDIQIDGDSAAGYDPSDVHVNIHVWSVAPGKIELRTIAGAVRDTLAPRSDRGPPFSLATAGHRLITWKFVQTIPMDDPDGISVKATVMLEYLTEPLS